jgi:chitinase
MKSNKILISLIVILLSSSVFSQNKQDENNRIVLAYVTSWSGIMPDPNYITHINYAFGFVNEEFNGVMINRPPRPGSTNVSKRATSEDRLKSLVELKKQKPSLKILLSIGGWGAGRFSEMAANETNRLAFAADCKRVVSEFGLDGIDMDWEYPTSSSSGISSSPDDMKNFTLLMRDIRNAIGKDKLLTFASASNAEYVDFKAVEPYINFVNIMTYDINVNGSAHHAGLFHSELTGNGHSCEESVDMHVRAGIPIRKLVLGMPFYGHGRDSVPRSINYRNMILRDDIEGTAMIIRREIVQLKSHKDMWDDVAKAPYWVDADNKFVLSYETPKSIALKCEWLNRKGMLGAMYWEYSGDDDQGSLRKAVYNGVMER